MLETASITRTTALPSMAALNEKQAAFVREYLIDFNGTKAAIRAGYAANSADVHAARLLGDDRISFYLRGALDLRAIRTEITADRVLRELAKIGFSDIRKIFSATGQLLSPADMDDEVAAGISSIEVVTRTVPGSEPAEVEYVHKIKMLDKTNALTQLARHLGLFEKDNERKLVVEDRTTLALGDLSDDAREEARELIDRMRMLHARNVTPEKGEGDEKY